MGARGHINTLYKIKKIDDSCTCDTFLVCERKKIKRCNININNLEKRIINSLKKNSSNKPSYTLEKNSILNHLGGKEDE